ncbi:MAG TPA: glycosyltransferase family 61 protein [Ramlibacter sp.]|nr:glycosyltransferase family 61 protein [Ramlibacter sp.]
MMKWFDSLVDREYYLARYPDVRQAGIDPVRHFLVHGWREGRSPSARLDIARREKSPPLAARILNGIHTGRMVAQSTATRYTTFQFAERGSRWLVEVMLRKRHPGNRLARVLHKTALADASSAFDVLEPAKPYSFLEPRVFGELAPQQQRTVDLPAKTLARVDHATVVGAFQVLKGHGFVCYEPAADPDNDFVAGIWPYVAKIAGTREVVTWYEYEREETLQEGILFSGRCSPNYFHWLVEYLGRAYILARSEYLEGVPLIVDADMFPQEFESLQAVLPGWPIHKLHKGTLLKVNHLHIPSIATFHPDSVRIPFWQGAGVCVETLAFLRERILRHYGIEPATPWRKVFIARRSGRNITNTDEVEQVMVDNGFEVVDTAALSLEQQVRLFQEARIVAGGMGAAFTNLIFCSPGARVLALSSPFTKRFCMQSNLAGFAGCSYLVLAGSHPQYRPEHDGNLPSINLVMDSFTIDIGQLRAALAQVQAD